MSEQSEIQICPLCTIRYNKDTGLYIYSTGILADSESVYSRVCGYARAAGKTGCINTEGTYVKEKGWLDMTPPSNVG
jgi:hypothetical protein